MTEWDWLVCTEAKKMLAFLRGQASERKLRLFACACSRRQLCGQLNPPIAAVVDVAERFADGRATMAGVWAVRKVARRAAQQAGCREWFVPSWVAARSRTREILWAPPQVEAAAPLVRDIFGNPFRPVVIDPAWLRWHDSLAVSMARRMYDSRDFTNMPVLADSLEEAGCTDRGILSHCRSGGEHVRGCWVVDLLLGKS